MDKVHGGREREVEEREIHADRERGNALRERGGGEGGALRVSEEQCAWREGEGA